jgi:hypothetical protein
MDKILTMQNYGCTSNDSHRLIAFDPMTNGQKLSGTVMQLYKAQAMLQKIKVVYNKAEFEIGSAKLGTDTNNEVKKAIGLFCYFKPETPFSKWGLERAIEAQKNCK